jgi:hypothetical protein
MMFNLIYFLFISLSFSYMWSFSNIFQPIRNIVSRIPYIRTPLICPECSSFWFGLLTSFIYNPIILTYSFWGLENVICGLVTHLVACFLYKKTKNSDNKIQFIN